MGLVRSARPAHSPAVLGEARRPRSSSRLTTAAYARRTAWRGGPAGGRPRSEPIGSSLRPRISTLTGVTTSPDNTNVSPDALRVDLGQRLGEPRGQPPSADRVDRTAPADQRVQRGCLDVTGGDPRGFVVCASVQQPGCVDAAHVSDGFNLSAESGQPGRGGGEARFEDLDSRALRSHSPHHSRTPEFAALDASAWIHGLISHGQFVGPIPR